MRNDKVGSLLDLELAGRVVDTKEGKCLGNMKTKPKEGCFFAKEVADIVECGSDFANSFLDASSFLKPLKDHRAKLFAKLADGGSNLLGTNQ